MNEMKLRALAKINLGLDVTGCRDDGYHEVKMIMQTVFLYDRILLRITKETTAGNINRRSLFLS